MSLAASLRAALEQGRRRDMALIASDGPFGAPTDPLPAAVLAAVVDRATPTMLFTTRTATLRTHAGQVAFPGGRIDPGDAGPIEAALREAVEEIALPRAFVEVVGLADPYRTVSGYAVTPVLGVIPPDLPLVPHDREVADWFEVPLAFLLDPAHHLARAGEWQGRERHYYEILWQDRRIWGATAAMVINLARRLDRP
jgi:8-oxo-dGTP pyrophosphatase MutT (NUDIX family)